MTLLPFISESQKVWHFKEIRLITFQMKDIMKLWNTILHNWNKIGDDCQKKFQIDGSNFSSNR